jgi:hypothetical protein
MVSEPGSLIRTMLDLTNTTFLIPLYIDSEDRLRNSKAVLGYLNHNFKTQVIIHEFFETQPKLDFLAAYS